MDQQDHDGAELGLIEVGGPGDARVLDGREVGEVHGVRGVLLRGQVELPRWRDGGLLFDHVAECDDPYFPMGMLPLELVAAGPVTTKVVAIEGVAQALSLLKVNSIVRI